MQHTHTPKKQNKNKQTNNQITKKQSGNSALITHSSGTACFVAVVKEDVPFVHRGHLCKWYVAAVQCQSSPKCLYASKLALGAGSGEIEHGREEVLLQKNSADSSRPRGVVKGSLLRSYEDIEELRVSPSLTGCSAFSDGQMHQPGEGLGCQLHRFAKCMRISIMVTEVTRG